jgi:hypothetical protein
MPSINVNPLDIPTPEDEKYWAEEEAAYLFQPPDRNAPKDKPEYAGWGIPQDRKAPTDAVEHVLCFYRESKLDEYCHDPREGYRYNPVHPQFKWALIEATYAHFLWFRTQEGGEYLNNFFAVEEVPPVYPGYSYKWVNPKSKQINELLPPEYGDDKKLRPGSVELRIFRLWERKNHPPVCAEHPHAFRQMSKLMRNSKGATGWSYRNPRARAPGEQKEGVYAWVSQQIQKWLLLKVENIEKWPYYKKDRTTGSNWLRDLKGPNGQPLFTAMSKISQYRAAAYTDRIAGPVRAYRIEQDGDVHWCAGNEMRIVPKPDAIRLEGRPDAEERIIREFTCKGCRRIKACVPCNPRETLCCNCYAAQLEQGTNMPTLNTCTMLPECKRCPDSIDSNTRLVTLKQQWSRVPHTETRTW